MSVRQNTSSATTPVNTGSMQPTQLVDMADAAASTSLAEGNNFNTLSADAPLKRNVVVSIKSTLNDLCLQKQRGTWAPSADALRSIFQYVCLIANRWTDGRMDLG